MKVKVISHIKTIKGIIIAGTIINITPAMFKKLKGQVELLPFDLDHWQHIIQELITNFGKRDLKGCFPWCREVHPDTWEKHRLSLRAIGTGYKTRDSSTLEEAVMGAKQTYEEMLIFWNQRHDLKQLSLHPP